MNINLNTRKVNFSDKEAAFLMSLSLSECKTDYTGFLQGAARDCQCDFENLLTLSDALNHYIGLALLELNAAEGVERNFRRGDIGRLEAFKLGFYDQMISR